MGTLGCLPAAATALGWHLGAASGSTAFYGAVPGAKGVKRPVGLGVMQGAPSEPLFLAGSAAPDPRAAALRLALGQTA